MAELHSWQRPIADKMEAALRRHDFCLAACTTGSGKTYCMLETAKRLGGRWLVCAPKSVRTAWLRAAEAMGASDNVADVINPEKISTPKGCSWYTRKGMWRLPAGDDRLTGAILDECHKGCSGPDSVTTLAFAQLKAYRVKLACLSATPFVSPVGMRMLSYWGGLSGFSRPEFYAWARRHGCMDVMMGDRKVFRFTRNAELAERHLSDIRAALGDRFINLTPDQIPGFPDEVRDVLLIDMAKRDREEIDSAYREMSDRLKSDAKSDQAAIGRLRERIEWTESAAVADLIAGSLENGNSAVCFLNYTAPRERLHALLIERGITDIASVYGGQKEADRVAQIDAFQRDELPVALVNAAAGGAGISLHSTTGGRLRESFIIPSFSAADMAQCMGRTRRVGGGRAVSHIVLVAGSAQEQVARTLSGKLRNLLTITDVDLMIP